MHLLLWNQCWVSAEVLISLVTVTLSDKYSTNLWLSYKCTFFPGFMRDSQGYFAFLLLLIASWSLITSLLETLDVQDIHLNWKHIFSFPQCQLWSSLISPLWGLFPSRCQWLRFYFHAMTDELIYCCSCSHALLQRYCLTKSAWLLPRFHYIVHDLPKCQDTLNKMTITTSSLFFTLPIKHFLPTKKQSKMYLLLTFWDKRSGICHNAL